MDLWRSMAAAWRRVFASLDDTIATGTAGAVAVTPGYAPLNAMSTAARFPWVVVCVNARLSDMSGLPLVAVRRDGALETVITDNQALSLLRRPSPDCSGLRYRRQVTFDWLLTGNSMSELSGPNLYRMHPALTVPQVDPRTGRVSSWVYNGRRRLSNESVLHVADVSWQATLEAVLGESRIRALHDDLTTVLAAKEMTRNQSKRGRPDIILTPEAGVNAGPRQIAEIESNWDRFTEAGKSLFVMGKGFKHSVMNFTPRDIEYNEQLTATRDTILAVFGVPPARAGLATANYGTQKQQMRTYWEDLLKGQAALFEDEWSTLTGDPNIRIEHDSTNIESLQLNRTERQLRAERWMNSFGMSPSKAAESEQFINLPADALPAVAPGNQSRPPAREPDEPQRQALAERLERYLKQSAARYQVRVLDADGDVSYLDQRSVEGLRVLEVLEDAGVDARTALQWSEEIAAVSDEAVQMSATSAWERGSTRIGFGAIDAFSEKRAATLAANIQKEAA